MSVGVPTLDDDDRCIARLVNLLRDVEGEDARRVVESCSILSSSIVRYHFTREERVMAWCGFPGVGFHRGEHEEFAHDLARLRHRYAAHGNSTIAGELRDRLTGWLCHHILIQDMAYKPYVLAADGGDTVTHEVGRHPPRARHRLPTMVVP